MQEKRRHPWENYVAIGDSFTVGLGDAVESTEPLGAADRLAAALRHSRPSLRYTNLAQPGLTSAEISAGQLEPALSLEPDLVSVVAGANDILGRAWDPKRFEVDLGLMFEALMRINATLVTVTLPKFPPAGHLTRLHQACTDKSEGKRDHSAPGFGVRGDLPGLDATFHFVRPDPVERRRDSSQCLRLSGNHVQDDSAPGTPGWCFH